MVQLWQYDWPGNVRELENLVERVVVLNRSGVIRAADLPRHVCTVTGTAGDGAAMAGNGCGIAPAARHM
jgi:two-component system response regulator AtoC